MINSSQKREEPSFLWTTHEHSREEVDSEILEEVAVRSLGPLAGGGAQQRWHKEPQASLVLEECSGTRGLWEKVGQRHQSSQTDRPVSGWPQASCGSSKVDATLGTVVHRATAQLGLLFLVPALFAEIREEGCNLSTGWNHRVCKGRKKRRDSHRECRAEARSGHNRVQKPEPVLLPPVSPGPHLARSPQKANREESSLGDLPFNPTIQPAHHPWTKFPY